MAFKNYLAVLTLALMAGSASAQNKVNARGELIGERWVGSMGVTESVEEIQARESANEGLRFSIVKIEKENPIDRGKHPV